MIYFWGGCPEALCLPSYFGSHSAPLQEPTCSTNIALSSVSDQEPSPLSCRLSVKTNVPASNASSDFLSIGRDSDSDTSLSADKTYSSPPQLYRFMMSNSQSLSKVLAELYDENVAAKILRVAQQGLVNNVGVFSYPLPRPSCSFNLHGANRTLLSGIQNMYHKSAKMQAHTSCGTKTSGLAASSQAASTL